MAILIDGDMMEAEVVPSAAPSAEELREEVELDAPSEDSLSTDSQKIVEHYVKALDSFVNSSGTTAFSEELARPYYPFLRFNKKMEIVVRSLSRDEYLDVLKVTSPELGEILSKTDLQDDLPAENIGIYNRNVFRNVHSSLNLFWEEGRTNIDKLRDCSSQMTLVPDMEYFCLFTGTNKQLLEYFTVNKVRLEKPLLVLYHNKDSGFVNRLTAEHHLPQSSDLFSQENLLNYVRKGSCKKLKDMIHDYERWTNHLTRRGDESKKREGFYQYLYKTHPELTI